MNFTKEFHTELSLIWSREFNKDLILPIKSLFSYDILSYSLARFGEAPPDIAFALEWLSQSLHLSFYTDKLKTETKNLIFQKILLKYKTLNNLNSDLDNQIDNYYLPRQIWFLQSKALDLLQAVGQRHPEVQKYLKPDYLNSFLENENLDNWYLQKSNITALEYINSQGKRLSFIKIGIPCLVALQYSFSQTDNPVNPKQVKWANLEMILQGIARLSELNNGKKFTRWLFLQNLTEAEEFEFLSQSEEKQLEIILADNDCGENTRNFITEVYNQTKTELENLILPEKNKIMLSDLLKWSMGEE